MPDQKEDLKNEEIKKDAVNETQSETQSEATKEDSGSNKRYILFVGNMPFGAMKEDIEKHFSCVKPRGDISSVRILTSKKTAKSKGCAFVEFSNSAAYNLALKLHHTSMNGRTINVEATAGGGGKGRNRTQKIKVKNEKIRKERVQHFQKNVASKKKQKKAEGTEQKMI